jgi:phosphonate degradation associated HDIG domain protein
MLTLAAIRTLFGAHGSRMYSGEPVTQLEHALQSAALAEEAGAPATLITASLLHDLGHMINDQGETPTLRGIDDRHEYVAIPRLRGLFSDAVLAPIRLHVEAKRYLCARGDGTQSGAAYLEALSADSLRSLQLQGGVFSAAQADGFIAQPFAAEAVRLRCWDDLAKTAGRSTPPLEHYLTLAASVALVSTDA